MSLTHEEYTRFNDTIAEYKLIELLNQGGMGAIYLAEDTRLKRQVAIKFFKTNSQSSEDDEAINAQTLQEAQLLARLNHPNIVQIHNVLTFGNFICIVMEYLKGKTLLQFQQQHVTSLTQKLTLLVDICSGIAHAHNQDVLHCDIKASNILIDQQQTKLTDFGISKLAVERTKEANSIEESAVGYGSLTAMSPEQIKNEPLDARSDLFSFGLLAFELIAGHHPFGKGSHQTIAKRIVEGKANDALRLIPKLPSEFALLLNRLLQKDKNKRPSSADSVQQQLQAILVALTQQSILEQETQVFDPAKHKKNTLFNLKSVSASALIALCAGGIYGYFNLSKTPERYVAFLPPAINLDKTSNANEALLNAALDESIGQSVINYKRLNLISRSEINAITPEIQIDQLNKETLEKIHSATGAEEVITADLSCEAEQCSLTLERLTAPDWTVQQRQQWPVVTDNYSYLYNSTKQQFATLFPDLQDTYLTLADINEEVLQEHLELYQQIVIGETYTKELVDRVEQLINKAPSLYANYDLLREVTLGVHADSQDEADLTKTKKVLFNAPLNYQATPSFIYNAAMLAITGHEWEHAENYIAKARQTGTPLYTIHELEGALYFEQDDLEKAQQAFELALKLRPNNVTKELLATVLWWQGEAAQARELLESILAIAPQSYVANQMLADIALFQGDLNLAVRSYETTLSISPNGTDYSHLSMAYSLLGFYQKALTSAKESVKIHPENTDFLLNLADMEKAVGQLETAKEHYSQILELNSSAPTTVDALLENAQAYSQLHQPQMALKALDAAINLSQDHSEYAFTAALVYSLVGEYQSAIINVEKSIEIGWNAIWFSLPWFKVLCNEEEYIRLIESYNSSLICE